MYRKRHLRELSARIGQRFAELDAVWAAYDRSDTGRRAALLRSFEDVANGRH